LEKWRERWDFKKSKILIDQSLLGTILEIEGSKNEIEEIVKLLGLGKSERTTQTYHELYQEYCREKGLKSHPRFIILPKGKS